MARPIKLSNGPDIVNPDSLFVFIVIAMIIIITIGIGLLRATFQGDPCGCLGAPPGPHSSQSA